MAIRVTCPSCHQRFEVSEKFAGREGPCPKCKGLIKIPNKDEEVVVHAPEFSGPKDSTGRLVLKPISREDTSLSGVQITLLVGAILVFLLVALLLRFVYPKGLGLPQVVPGAGLAILGPLLAYSGYAFIRDQERGYLTGKNLWMRTAICGLIYAISWLLLFVGWYAFNNSWELGSVLMGMGLMIALGTTTAVVCLELDWIQGLLHYGLFLGCCLLLRWLAGWGFMPGSQATESAPAAPASTSLLWNSAQHLLETWLL
jgi:hypothetical protein